MKNPNETQTQHAGSHRKCGRVIGLLFERAGLLAACLGMETGEFVVSVDRGKSSPLSITMRVPEPMDEESPSNAGESRVSTREIRAALRAVKAGLVALLRESRLCVGDCIFDLAFGQAMLTIRRGCVRDLLLGPRVYWDEIPCIGKKSSCPRRSGRSGRKPFAAGKQVVKI